MMEHKENTSCVVSLVLSQERDVCWADWGKPWTTSGLLVTRPHFEVDTLRRMLIILRYYQSDRWQWIWKIKLLENQDAHETSINQTKDRSVTSKVRGTGTGQSGVRIPVGVRYFYLHQKVETTSAFPIQWLPGFLSGSKAAGAWSWQLVSI